MLGVQRAVYGNGCLYSLISLLSEDFINKKTLEKLGVRWWLLSDMWGVRRAAAHALHRRAAKVRLSILHPPPPPPLASSGQEQRESGQAVDGQVQYVVDHHRQGEEMGEVARVLPGKCGAEERNCCSCGAGVCWGCCAAACSGSPPAKCDVGGPVRQSYGAVRAIVRSTPPLTVANSGGEEAVGRREGTSLLDLAPLVFLPEKGRKRK